MSRIHRKKLVIVGSSGCGKTSLLFVFARDHFPEKYERIFSAHAIDIEVDDKCVELSVWDTLGQNEEEKIRTLAYPDTDAFIVCYSVNDQSSFEDVSNTWLPEISKYCPGVPFILVANKAELRDHDVDAMISPGNGLHLADTIGAYAYKENSAKLLTGVKEVFESATRAAFMGKKKKKCVIS